MLAIKRDIVFDGPSAVGAENMFQVVLAMTIMNVRFKVSERASWVNILPP